MFDWLGNLGDALWEVSSASTAKVVAEREAERLAALPDVAPVEPVASIGPPPAGPGLVVGHEGSVRVVETGPSAAPRMVWISAVAAGVMAGFCALFTALFAREVLQSGAAPSGPLVVIVAALVLLPSGFCVWFARTAKRYRIRLRLVPDGLERSQLRAFGEDVTHIPAQAVRTVMTTGSHTYQPARVANAVLLLGTEGEDHWFGGRGVTAAQAEWLRALLQAHIAEVKAVAAE